MGLERYAHLAWGCPLELTRSRSYSRELITPYGSIADLRVPKLRRGNGALSWQSIPATTAVGDHFWTPGESYCLGYSLRDLQGTRALTLGEMVSLSAYNRIVSSVAEQIKAFKTQLLESLPPIVLVDGMWVKIADPTGDHGLDTQGRLRAVKRKEKRVVLSALGLWGDGHWEIVHWQSATGETEASWHHFLGELSHKGLTEETTKLVGSDGSSGLESALDDHVYGVPHQRCIFHKIKNLADHLVFDELDIETASDEDKALRQARQARKKAILADASAVYEDHVEAEIRQRAAHFRDKWQGREPEAVAAFFVDFDKTFAYLKIDFPDSLLSLIRTTNLLERFHREARRKQHDIGMFQSKHGCEVLWYLMAMRETAKQQALLKCNQCRL